MRPSSASTTERTGPLSGARVIDLTSNVMGPYCTSDDLDERRSQPLRDLAGIALAVTLCGATTAPPR